MIELHDEVLVNLRRIMRASDIYSRRLKRESGLTTPQLVVLKSIQSAPLSSVKDISNDVNLSQATVTSILNRLENMTLVRRSRSTEDRRRVEVSLTKSGNKSLADAPRPLQDEFVQAFNGLPEWEQHMLVAALGKIAVMMNAETLDVAPVLVSEGDITT